MGMLKLKDLFTKVYFYRFAIMTADQLTSSENKKISKKLKLIILVWLTLQSSVHALLIKYTRIQHGKTNVLYFPSVAVFMMELIKMVFSFIMVYFQSNGILWYGVNLSNFGISYKILTDPFFSNQKQFLNR